MAENSDLIIELLREMKRANNASSDSFDRLLANINDRLDVMDRHPASAELIKAYLEELANASDEKYSAALNKFYDIENALKSLFNQLDEHVKTGDIRELFDIFAENLNNFYSEARQQKAVLSGIERKLADISGDKSDKEDIIRTITLLRSDFENLNHSYKSTIDIINSDLKTILSNIIKSGQKSSSSKEQIDIMYNAISDIVSCLKSVDKRDVNLEKLLSNVATNESLKIAQGALDSIIKKSEEISGRVALLSDKLDIETLQGSAGLMIKKLDSVATKDLFTQISGKADVLAAQSDEVKQTLALISKNIEALPDTKLIDALLQNLYNALGSLAQDINRAKAKEDIRDISGKISNLTLEFSTLKNIIDDINEIITSKIVHSIEDISFANESYDIKNHVSKMLAMLPQKEDIDRILENNELSKKTLDDLIKKSDSIADRLESLPTHDDMAALNSTQLSLVENLQDVAGKDDIEELSAKSDEIEDMIDKLNFDDEFAQLYDKTTSIEKWLEKSKIKENSEEVLSQIPNKAEQKDIIEILKTTEKIVADIRELSNNVDVKKVNRTVAEVYSIIEDLKNDFMNTTEMHHDSVVVQLSELQKSITKIATAEDFNNFVDDLKSFVETTVESSSRLDTNIAELKDYEKTIIEKINNIDTSAIEEIMSRQADTAGGRLTSLSEYLADIAKTNKTEIQKSLSEIIEILENKKSNYDEIEKANTETLLSIENYLKEIKTILDTSDKGLSDELTRKITALEKEIHGYNTSGRDTLGEILSKIQEYKLLIETDNKYSKTELENSFSEIIEIKERIKELGTAFNVLNENNPNNISQFISDKLNEISANLDILGSDTENQLQQGFAYNAELIEEKTSALLDLIKELRQCNSDNIELYERLTAADNSLIDFKQELELINTDIISNLNTQTEELINEITPIKKMLEDFNTASVSAAGGSIKEHLEVIHDCVRDDLTECTKYSKSTYDKLEDTYTRITGNITEAENNLRNFILTDIDSVIVKVDGLAEDLNEALSAITPPQAQAMGEFREFVNRINEFKEEQKSLIADAAEDIKTSVSDKIKQQHEELKSILAVSINNEEIINAIDGLKECFKNRIQELKKIQLSAIKTNADEFEINQYEQAFEADENIKVIKEIKNDFDKFSLLIKDLSENNPEIEEILGSIKDKIESITPAKPRGKNSDQTQEAVASEIPDSYFDDEDNYNADNGGDEDILAVTNNFDIIKALDLLKHDIQSLHSDVEKVISKEEQKQASAALKSIPALSGDNLLLNLNNKIDTLSKVLNRNWLEEIKNYLAGSDIHTMLEEIKSKIEVLTLSDNSGWIDEIKQVLEHLNSSGISEAAAVNGNVQAMLDTINNKIDILASADDYEIMEDVRDALEKIAEPDTNTGSGNDKLLNLINSKIDILASSDNYEDIEDIKYTLINIDQKADGVKKLSDADAKITEMLETLNRKIDVMSSDENLSSKQDVEDIKQLILTQMDYIEKLEKNNKTDVLKNCFKELVLEVNNLNTTDNAAQIQKILKDMKESVLSAVITIFEQVSFVEESEDIKDFVEEKTDEINENLTAVTNQLKQITNSDDTDYTYSMQDIESDLAKLRLALNSAQESEQTNQARRLSFILDNINQIGNTVEDLQDSLTKDEVFGLKTKFDRINTDIKSLNAVTNQLLQKSDESYNAINSDIKSFGNILAGQLTSKVDTATRLLEKADASDKVMRRALIYMGEWIDCASESMNKISANSNEIIEVKSTLESLKTLLPEQTGILNSIEEKFDRQQERLKFFEKQISGLDILKERFEEQQERIDRLEMSLDKILSAVEEIDDSKVNRKIDKIDKQITKLSTNIEKLASYVD